MSVDPTTEACPSSKRSNEIDAGLLGTLEENECGSEVVCASHRNDDIDDEQNRGCDAKLLDFKEMRNRGRKLRLQILENEEFNGKLL